MRSFYLTMTCISAIFNHKLNTMIWLWREEYAEETATESFHTGARKRRELCRRWPWSWPVEESRLWLIRLYAYRCFLWLTASISLNAATAASAGYFLVSRKKPSAIAQTHLIIVSLLRPSGRTRYRAGVFKEKSRVPEKLVLLFLQLLLVVWGSHPAYPRRPGVWASGEYGW